MRNYKTCLHALWDFEKVLPGIIFPGAKLVKNFSKAYEYTYSLLNFERLRLIVVFANVCCRGDGLFYFKTLKRPGLPYFVNSCQLRTRAW